MIVEVVAVGTELLIGQIVNTNAAYIGARLSEEGFDCHHQTVVGDNLDRLSKVIVTAIDRADAVILTGGIGPTQDDLTREAICRVTGRKMVRNDDHAELIRQRVQARRGVVADSVLRMADHPVGSEPLPNSQGVALGIALHHRGTMVFAVPGVPREMKALLEEEVMPRLRKAAGVPAVIRSRVLHTWGYGESQVAEILDDLYVSRNPSIAFLITDMEVKVRITAKAADGQRAEEMIGPFEAEVRRRLGEVVFAVDDQTVIDVISTHAERLPGGVGVCEIGTVGKVGARLAAAKPAWFAGAITLPPGPSAAVALADQARSRGASVGLGVSDAVRVDDSGELASLITFAVADGRRIGQREMRFFGVGERAESYAVGAALHHLRLAMSGVWWDCG